MAERDQEFVEYVVKSIVDSPDKVRVNRTVDEMGVLLELDVDSADMGKIIGKDGRTAKAIRTLLRVIGAQNHSRVNLKIIEPAGGMRSPEAADGGDHYQDQPAAVDMPATTTMSDLSDIAEE